MDINRRLITMEATMINSTLQMANNMTHDTDATLHMNSSRLPSIFDKSHENLLQDKSLA